MTDLSERPEGYALSDRYTHDDGRVFLQGTQALARFPLEQLRVDRAAGLQTAVFASGYPGSPLAGFDKEASAAARIATGQSLEFIHQPGLNEELAATAVMGTQLAMEAGARQGLDGVIGIWYGKAPGLDRACDAIRHGVFAGTSAHGGVVALVGDDPAAKSSTLPSSSDATLVDLHIPILYPGDVQEAIDLGRHAIALSRAAGLWTSLKVVAGVADGTGTVDLDPSRVQPVIPTMEWKGRQFVPHPSGRLLTPFTLDLEREFQEVRSELARRYGIENGLNRITANPSDAWIGIASSGYTYHELLEALRLLGFPDQRAIEAAGIRLLQLRMPVPLDVSIVREFAHGLTEIFVIEEKNPTLEWLVKDALYGWDERPLVVGKRAEDGSRLIPSAGHTDADAIIEPLRRRLSQRLSEDRLAPLPTPGRKLIPLSALRAPHFCSGCPHNWSTKVPDGSLYGAGIGCHGMTTLMPEERVGTLAGIGAMGNEGAQWVGMAPFVTAPHLIQNLGDGTFFHSGSLAIRFAVASGVNITYKLLYNGTVAMTGGQDAPGAKPVPDVVRMLLLEGVKQVLITSDDTDKYAHIDLPTGVKVWDRTRIVEAQEILAKVAGVTVLIHDQACAAELRRDRKRGLATTPARRVIINHRICEGCGDCGEKSNCLSVQPHETPFGRKTQIDQTSCNLDFSCLNGDCPSFATVEISAKTKPARKRSKSAIATAALVEPPLRVPTDCTIRMPGIGGTGVVTVSQVLGTAALLDGKHVRGLDQTGLSQKAGVVVSDVRISSDAAFASNKATHGGVDVVIAFDLLAATADAQIVGSSADRTIVIASIAQTPTGAMIVQPSIAYPELAELHSRIDATSRATENVWVDAAALAKSLFDDTTTANVLLLGVAFQSGCIPLSSSNIEKALDINGVAVQKNVAAFRAGRQWVVDGASAEQAVAPAPETLPTVPKSLRARTDLLAEQTGLGETIVRRVGDLVDYQSVGYAEKYLRQVERVAALEAEIKPGDRSLTRAVAEQLHRLMAYKDEYEVARLLLLPEARAAAEDIGGAGAVVRWHLHPPMLRSLGMHDKLKLSARTAPIFRTLAAGKRVRGTALDPFGRTKVRRLERALITEYLAALDKIERTLTIDNHREAVSIAVLPDQVRGYEDIKVRRAETYRAELAERLKRF